MTIRLNPYVNWRGQAREALTRYHEIFGGELQIMTFTDLGAESMGVSAEEADWVMHGALTVSDSVLLMGADMPSNVPGEVVAQQISISGPSEDSVTLRTWFDGLAESGTILEPLTAAPWGDVFGMIRDRFGVDWVVNIGIPEDV